MNLQGLVTLKIVNEVYEEVQNEREVPSITIRKTARWGGKDTSGSQAGTRRV